LTPWTKELYLCSVARLRQLLTRKWIRMTASPCPEADPYDGSSYPYDGVSRSGKGSYIFCAFCASEPNVGILPLLRNQSFHTENVCNGYCFTYLLRFVFFSVLSAPQMFVMCVYEDRHKKIKNEHLHTKKTKIA
jgi:hypothetical protein